ncbi:formylglycine-generating enzyme family protein [Aestuariibius sp. HNIBRBA575]|uniref:formylglycine-generating enzyme family protein n=1 Tax=Aestuariibius sp. HNIBRBA575 TaxID=3233343 RepID=UPI0034A38F52
MQKTSFDIIWFDGGKSHIGTNQPEIKTDGESPARKVTLASFGLGSTTVTYADFAEFIAATQYVTDAETYGWSFVFRGLMDTPTAQQAPGLPWWNTINGATWRRPLGPDSDGQCWPDHPVVHVSWNDARAYADWLGGRLPTEAEWEHAARSGAEPKRYPWGDDEPSDTNAGHCNIWQGKFPDHNTQADGFYGTAPAQSFPPNAAGLYNLSGNVWEWCDDPFKIRSVSPKAKKRNQLAKKDNERVLKGGSFLCHASTCWRYRIAARSGRQADNGASNCGFRVAFDRET